MLLGEVRSNITMSVTTAHLSLKWSKIRVSISVCPTMNLEESTVRFSLKDTPVQLINSFLSAHYGKGCWI